MTDLSSNLKGNGMMDLRLPENVHRETENDHMGLELRRTGQKPWQLEGAVPGVWESALQRRFYGNRKDFMASKSQRRNNGGEKEAGLLRLLISSLKTSRHVFLT